MKPFCEDCKTHHFPHQAHVWPKVEKKEVFEGIKNKPAKQPIGDGLELRAGHNAYMREYMRKWRASKKGVKGE